ncbi:MAG: hypothetical protein M5U28_06460 [Sandaracinaceae bacterium]|nr:hypothetical protein [Sandaracinaceae bacterium]
MVFAVARQRREEVGEALRFLGALLPFFDRPERAAAHADARLADFLTRLARDDEAIGALERLGTRQGGYRPLRLALGVTRPVMAYPEFDTFADLALATIIDGAAAEEFTELQRALALDMATMEPEHDGGGRALHARADARAHVHRGRSLRGLEPELDPPARPPRHRHAGERRLRRAPRALRGPRSRRARRRRRPRAVRRSARRGARAPRALLRARRGRGAARHGGAGRSARTGRATSSTSTRAAPCSRGRRRSSRPGSRRSRRRSCR